jgi:uncharacterized protein DUF3866
VAGRLKLRRGIVAGEEPLEVEVDGERRPAWADTVLLGEMREGDEVIVNVEARELGLGSGGFDVVHVNLSRGLRGGDSAEQQVVKLNYTSLQHSIDTIERPLAETGREGHPVLVLPLHGHLAATAWAAAQAAPGARIGYVQTGGGALPGPMSRDVAELRERDLLCGHLTAAPAYGGEHESVSVPGALDAAAEELGWDAVLVGPGPGIIGSGTALGHGGMAALDSAHAALSLKMRTLLSPRLSAADPRERHRSVSHHTLTVMRLLLAGVEIPVPSGYPVATAVLAGASGWRHRLREAPADLSGYAAAGLPARVMDRGIEDDPLFFAAPLAAGRVLGEVAHGSLRGEG